MKVDCLRLSVLVFVGIIEFSMAKDSKPQGKDPPPFVNPFNQGNSLFETPYSGSINAMGSGSGGFMQSMMTMGGGGGRNGLPSMFMKDGKLQLGRQQCLKNIVCPQYCHEIDEHGCESCPCGPGYVEQQQKKKEEEKKNSQCIQTLLCMLSCKEGYELGKKGEDGCQTCKCVKKDNSKNIPKQTGQNGNKNGTSGSSSGSQGPFGGATGSESGSAFNPMNPGAGMGSGSGMTSSTLGGSQTESGGDSNSCVGPFCHSSGAGMPSPFGGGSSGGVAMSPFGLASGGGKGRDCFGPECSAKNGMKLLGEVKHKEEDCRSTTLCIKTCAHDLKLGPKGSDGCPSCACVKSEVSTTSSPRQEVCGRLLKCMMGCTGGYILGSADASGCPSCSCKSNPTTPAPVTKSSCQKIMDLCVQNCRHGYQLIPASTVGECASCICRPAPTKVTPTRTAVVVHHSSCEDTVVKCMTDCRYGYVLKATGSGRCPRCQCLPTPPRTETAVTVSTTSKPNIYSILKNCPEAIHCMVNCKTGYAIQTIPGEECPHCTCQTVLVQTLTCTAALSCPRGCSLGYRKGSNGCPTCSCIIPSEVGVLTHSAIYVDSSIRCNAHFSCSKHCEFGYRSGDNSCPTCQCLVPVKVTSHSASSHGCTSEGCQHHIVSSGTIGHVVNTHQSGTHAVPLNHVINHPLGSSVQLTHILGSKGEISSQNTISMLLKYCANVARCVRECPSGFSLTGTEAGKCPACTCAGTINTILTETKHPSAPPGVHPSEVQVKPSLLVHHNNHPDVHTMCPETFRCGERCANGFTLKNVPGSTCPTCYCIADKVVPVTSEITVSPPLIPPVHTGSHLSVNSGSSVPNVVPVEIVSSGPAPLVHVNVPGQQVPETGTISTGNQGVSSGSVHFNILRGPGELASNNPASHNSAPGHPPMPGGHAHFSNQNCIGPACSAKNGLHNSHVKKTPPSLCARLIHCVLTCHDGYKLKDKDENGCPDCECLPN